MNNRNVLGSIHQHGAGILDRKGTSTNNHYVLSPDVLGDLQLFDHTGNSLCPWYKP